MKVFIVQYDCKDFYCDREHILNVFASREAAQFAIDNVADYWASQNTVATEHYEYDIGEWEVMQ